MSIQLHGPASRFVFRLTIAPHDAFAHRSWTAALDGLAATAAEGGSALLLGPPGTGKTLLLRALADRLRDLGHPVHLSSHQPDAPAADAVLLIDEAGRFSRRELARVCLRDAPTILAGLPELRPRVAACIGVIGAAQLEPLTPEDVARFVSRRLAAAGRPAATFTPEALLALAHHSAGLLRLVISLAGAALFAADQRRARAVERADVEDAAAMRAPAPAPLLAERDRPRTAFSRTARAAPRLASG